MDMKISNLDLKVECVKWLSSYLNKNSTYVDIGFGDGVFVRSFDFCKEIIAYDNNEKNIAELKNTNNKAIKIYNRIPTPYEIKKNIIDLVRINIENTIQVLELYNNIFRESVKYIFMKISNDEERTKLISMNYKIVDINSIGMILAVNKKFCDKEDNATKFYNVGEIVEKYLFDDLNSEEINDINVWNILVSYYKKESIVSTAKCLEYLIKKTTNISKIYVLYFMLGMCNVPNSYNILNNVVFSPHSPLIYTNSALEKQTNYIEKIKTIKTTQLNCKKKGYFSSTPSITLINGLYYAFVRLVNYKIEEKYIVYGDKCRSLYTALTYSKNFDLLEEKEISVDIYEKYSSNVLGVEDIRIYDNNKFFFISYEVTEKNYPAVCSGKYLSDINTLTDIKHLTINNDNIPEKNWLPFIIENVTYFIYSILPLQIYKITNDNISLHLEHFTNVGLFSGLRGSSPPIPYDNGLIFVAHQVCESSRFKYKIYLHRFVWLSNDYSVIKIGKLFYFNKLGIEYNTSLLNTGHNFILTYSVMDSSSYIIEVEYGSVKYDLTFNNII